MYKLGVFSTSEAAEDLWKRITDSYKTVNDFVTENGNPVNLFGEQKPTTPR